MKTQKHGDGSLTTHSRDGYEQQMGSQRIKHSLKRRAQKNCKTERNPKKNMIKNNQMRKQKEIKIKQKLIKNQFNIVSLQEPGSPA